MRFLLDQSADARLAAYLQSKLHDAVRIGREYPGGLTDNEVLALAYEEMRILITDDRDFGELAFRRGQPRVGVIFFRLGDYVPLGTKIERLDYVLTHFGDRLDQFLVVEPRRTRVRRVQQSNGI